MTPNPHNTLIRMDTPHFRSQPRRRSLQWAGLVLVLALDASFADVPDVVFVSRAFDTVPDPLSREHAIERAQSGKLLVREADGTVRVLVDATQGAPGAAEDTPADVMDPDVSFDSTRIVFAGFSDSEDAWRIFEVGADGTGLRQLTRSDREIDLDRYGKASELLRDYHDIDPCYLPDGRICCVSTRYVGVAPDGRVRANNLYVMDADGGNLRRITSERFGADTPAVEPATGRIVYSRFWRTPPFTVEGQAPAEPILPGSPDYEVIVVDSSDQPLRGISDADFPGVNSWFLAGINPDGTGLQMWSGFRLDRELTQAYRPSFLPNGEALALFLPVTPLLGYPRGYGLRRFPRGPAAPVALGGPQVFARRHLLPPEVDFYYASAVGLSDGSLLVTAVPRPRKAETPDYAIYVQENAAAQPALLYNAAGTLELDAVPLEDRPLPPVLEDAVTTVMSDDAPRDKEEAFAEGGSFTFLCENIFFNAPVDTPVANAPPVGKQLSIEFFLSSQRQSTDGGDKPVMLDRFELAPDGRVEATAPAGVPLFERLTRPDGSIAMGRDGQIFHVAGANFGRVGTTARCVGCHAGHTQIDIPADPSWTNLAPSAFVRASSTRFRDRLNTGDFLPANLVDRRTGTQDVEWAAANEAAEPTVELLWSTTLRARQVVLYGIQQGVGTVGERTQVIRGLTLSTSLAGAEQERINVTAEIEPEGTRVDLNPELDFDTLTIRIPAGNVSGLYEGQPGTAIAEVEVISKATAGPIHSFLRGDTNCDKSVNLSDAITTLNFLFLEGIAPCCVAAADADSNDELSITDPIAILNVLFQGADPLPEPSRDCGPVPAGPLTCDVDICP